MKLRNKKTGEIIDIKGALRDSDDYPNHYLISDDWEDAPEEPKEYWWIDTGSIPMVRRSNNPILSIGEDMDKEIGNYFESEGEAKRAVEKLKAWKRLKDKGFRFKDLEETYRGELGDFTIYAHIEPDYSQKYDEFDEDLYLLFGGEE